MAQTQLEQTISEADAKEKKRFSKGVIITLIILLVLAAGTWFAMSEVMHRTTDYRMKKMVSKAHTFAMISELWKARGKEIESGIYRVQADQDSGFEAYLDYYFGGDSKGHWFGLVLDENGSIVYTMYSRTEIPEECLQEKPDYDEQNTLLGSRFGFKRKKTIAVWAPEEPTDAAETENE